MVGGERPVAGQSGGSAQGVAEGRVTVTAVGFSARREDRSAGDTLGAILGLGYDDDTDPDQLARLGTALHLSQRHINNMWIPASGWGYQA